MFLCVFASCMCVCVCVCVGIHVCVRERERVCLRVWLWACVRARVRVGMITCMCERRFTARMRVCRNWNHDKCIFHLPHDSRLGAYIRTYKCMNIYSNTNIPIGMYV